MTQKINSIDDALSFLEEAAKERKNELMQKLGGRYRHIGEIFSGFPRSHTTRDRVLQAIRGSEKNLEQAIKKGRNIAGNSIHRVDEEIHKNPLRYLAGLAIASFILGYSWNQKK